MKITETFAVILFCLPVAAFAQQSSVDTTCSFFRKARCATSLASLVSDITDLTVPPSAGDVKDVLINGYGFLEQCKSCLYDYQTNLICDTIDSVIDKAEETLKMEINFDVDSCKKDGIVGSIEDIINIIPSSFLPTTGSEEMTASSLPESLESPATMSTLEPEQVNVPSPLPRKVNTPTPATCKPDAHKECEEKVPILSTAVMKQSPSTPENENRANLIAAYELAGRCFNCALSDDLKSQICVTIEYLGAVLEEQSGTSVPIPAECTGGDGEVSARFFWLLAPIISPIIRPIVTPIIKPIIAPVVSPICPAGNENGLCVPSACPCSEGLTCLTEATHSFVGALMASLKVIPLYGALELAGLTPGVCLPASPFKANSWQVRELAKVLHDKKDLIGKARDYAMWISGLPGGSRHGFTSVKDLLDSDSDLIYAAEKFAVETSIASPYTSTISPSIFSVDATETSVAASDKSGVTVYLGNAIEVAAGLKGSINSGIYYDSKGNFGIFVCTCSGVGAAFTVSVEAFVGIQFATNSLGGTSRGWDFDIAVTGIGPEVGMAWGHSEPGPDHKLHIEVSTGAGVGYNLYGTSTCYCDSTQKP